MQGPQFQRRLSRRVTCSSSLYLFVSSPLCLFVVVSTAQPNPHHFRYYLLYPFSLLLLFLLICHYPFTLLPLLLLPAHLFHSPNDFLLHLVSLSKLFSAAPSSLFAHAHAINITTYSFRSQTLAQIHSSPNHKSSIWYHVQIPIIITDALSQPMLPPPPDNPTPKYNSPPLPGNSPKNPASHTPAPPYPHSRNQNQNPHQSRLPAPAAVVAADSVPFLVPV